MVKSYNLYFNYTILLPFFQYKNPYNSAICFKLSRISIPSTSLPTHTQPLLCSRANNSIRGISPISCTIRSRTISGFLLWYSIGVSTTLCTLFDTRFGFPFVAMIQISGFALVQNPNPQNHFEVCFLHLFTQRLILKSPLFDSFKTVKQTRECYP